MTSIFSKRDSTPLNFFIKTINDSRRENKILSLDEVSVIVKEKFGDNTIHWLPKIKHIVQDAETKLFSYGSLQPGKQNEHMLRNIPGRWYEGFVYGELIQSGWGSSLGYPVLMPAYTDLGQKVYGKLFIASGLADYWTVLDDFEGEDYIRLLTLVYTIPSETITIAFVYAASNKIV